MVQVEIKNKELADHAGIMETVINIKLWNENVAAVEWDKEKEYATIEFYNSFAKNSWDIAPLQMPVGDILRGERIFSFPANPQ